VSASLWSVSRLHSVVAFAALTLAAKATPAMTSEQNVLATLAFSSLI
jgi:hypothetical protein